MIKKLSFPVLLMFSCFAALPLQAQWTRLELPMLYGNSGQFFTDSNGILVRVDHGIFHSSDQGLHWKLHAPGSFDYITHEGNDWYAVYSDGSAFFGSRLFHSSDGARTWPLVNTFKSNVSKMTVQNGLIYAMGDYGYLSQLLRYDPATQLIDTVWAKNQQDKVIWDVEATANSIFMATDWGLFRFRNNAASIDTLFDARPAKCVAIHGDTVFALVISENAPLEYSLHYSLDDGNNWVKTLFTLSKSPDEIDIRFAGNSAFIFCEDDQLVLKLSSPYQTQTTFAKNNNTDIILTPNGTYLMVGSSGVVSRKAPERNWITSNTGIANTPLYYNNVEVKGDLLQSWYEFSADTGKTWSSTLIWYFQKPNGGLDSTSYELAGTIVEHNGYYYAWAEYLGLLRSTDRRNWTRLHSHLNLDVHELYKFGDRLLIRYYQQLSESDDGVTWQETHDLTPGSELIINGLVLHQTVDGQILTSTDRGASWHHPIGFPNTNGVELDGWAASGETLAARTRKSLPFGQYEYKYYISQDGGYHWGKMGDPPTSPNDYNLFVIKDNKVFLTNGELLLVTANAGENWAYIDRDSITGSVVNIDFKDDLMIVSTNEGAWMRPVSGLKIRNYSGTVFLDPNNNQVQDLGEPGIPGIVLHLSSRNLYATTDSLGHYELFVEAIDDTLRPAMIRDYWVSTPGQIILQPAQEINNFAVYIPAGIRDVEIVAVEKTPFRFFGKPQATVFVTNHGSEPIGPFQVTLANYKSGYPIIFLNSDPASVFNMGDSLTWEIPGLPVLGKAAIQLQFNCPFDPLIYGFRSILPFEAVVAGDSFPQDNHYKLISSLVGPYDPNDKIVSPDQVLQTDLATTTFQYTIRFQNTGNYPADLVVIRDTLPEGLDFSSIQVLGASHPFTWRLHDDGVAEFRFEHINLPDSTTDEPNSHGFVAFRMNLDTTLVVGNSVLNRAAIYFDYNPPVMTEYASIKVTELSQTQTPGIAQQFEVVVYPNPTGSNTKLNIRWPDWVADDARIAIFDAHGRTIGQFKASGSNAQLPLTDLPPGIYWVQVNVGKFSEGKALMIR